MAIPARRRRVFIFLILIMDNIINPAGQVRSVSHRGSRWARLWIAVVAAGVAAGLSGQALEVSVARAVMAVKN